MPLCIARDPGVRLRDIADRLSITERSAHGIVADLAEAGYVVKHKDGRCNRYQIQVHMTLRVPAGQGPAIGEVLALLTGAAPTSDGTARTGDQDASGNPQALPQTTRPGGQHSRAVTGNKCSFLITGAYSSHVHLLSRRSVSTHLPAGSRFFSARNL